ncbi:2,3-dihydroxybenzoate decarboxylase [Talaromyces islandicus]|uniref:2,3-dihydroxybenzoate decarboxylase n=1 Tax=Talaromyces islandicus TaxID=28573 RepID=A0A0U1LNC1_TALIS|nr:2,3-dihydroxybenzoate decarboxylase [Talaromyces islandicus]
MKTQSVFLSFLSAALVRGAPASAPGSKNESPIYITLEEHYDPPVTNPLQTDPVVQLMSPLMTNGVYGKSVAEADSLNRTRLDSMDKNRIRIQVVSNDPTPPALTKPDTVKTMNDQLAAAIAPYPERFRGFCFLAMALPEQAAAELERCVLQLGFVGALVDTHLADETFYESSKFDPIWETAQRLDVPIYLHPTYPMIDDVNGTQGRFKSQDNDWPADVAAMLGTAVYGWHTDCGLHFLRLWLGGVFDRFPNVKLALGHMGETVPYMLDRANSTLAWAKPSGKSLPEAWATNVWVTTSGFFSLNPFATLLRTTSTDRIMFSIDYPWATNEEGAAFMDSLKESGMVSHKEWEDIAYRNAVNFLKLE